MNPNKKNTLLLFFLAVLYTSSNGQPKMAHQKFTVEVGNSSLFDLQAEPLPDEGQGYFMKYTTPLRKGKSFRYECENPNAMKGVEGHLKFRAYNNEVSGWIDIYFDNPAVGSMKYEVKSDWPFMVTQVIPFAEKRIPNLWLEITADTAHYGGVKSGIKVSGVSGSNKPVPNPNMDEPIPPIINFDWEVQQRMRKDDDDDDDHNGKAYKEVTYFFTSGGEYAAVKPEDKSFSLMVYSKKGHTWLFDDKKKTITVMSMPKTVGEGAAMGKAIAEDIKKAPLHKDRDDETITITKTGKTKSVLGYTADEYEMKNNRVQTTSKTSKTGTASFWYAKVPFDPVKIYTMGAGRPADMSAMQKNPKMKNNIAAIPVLNQNYLWVETEAGAIKGMETTTIKKVNNTINTAGYTIKVMNGLKDLLTGDDNN